MREGLPLINLAEVLKVFMGLFISWNYTKHVRYTVRSGYHLKWKYQFGPGVGQQIASGGSATNPVWKVIWKPKAPSTVKIFIGRTLHEILPLKCILVNRHIDTRTSGQCPICNQGHGDIMHLLFACPTAKFLWQEPNLSTMIKEATQVDRASYVVLEHINSSRECYAWPRRGTKRGDCDHILVLMVDASPTNSQ